MSFPKQTSHFTQIPCGHLIMKEGLVCTFRQATGKRIVIMNVFSLSLLNTEARTETKIAFLCAQYSFKWMGEGEFTFQIDCTAFFGKCPYKKKEKVLREIYFVELCWGSNWQKTCTTHVADIFCQYDCEYRRYGLRCTPFIILLPPSCPSLPKKSVYYVPVKSD